MHRSAVCGGRYKVFHKVPSRRAAHYVANAWRLPAPRGCRNTLHNQEPVLHGKLRIKAIQTLTELARSLLHTVQGFTGEKLGYDVGMLSRTLSRPSVSGLAVVACCLSLAACGGERGAVATDGPAPLTAATLGEQQVRAPSEYLSEAPYVSASPQLGERLLMQCRACHTLDEGASHSLGPNLYGMFGRRVGTADGYGYTRALRDAEFVWTPRALDAWLGRPQQFLPGNAMAFGGLNHADDRAAVIAALLRQTADSVTR